MRGLSFGVMGDDSLNWVGYNLVGFGGQLPDQYGDFIPKLRRNKLVSVPRSLLIFPETHEKRNFFRYFCVYVKDSRWISAVPMA